MKYSKLAAKYSPILRAIGNDKRLEVAYLLRDGEKKVSELEELIGISQSALSQHLAVMRAAGIVSTRRQSQSIYYSLSEEKCIKILELLDGKN
ncbi:MAG: winged helix-turn-helix transcriptional regulator [Alphaproteobacteria bacterium]|nr:winged helix-turn-helix transcriptional regulator [Alphaproteobacteria bacterium]